LIAKQRQLEAIEITNMTWEDLEEVLSIERASFPAPWSKSIFVQELYSPVSHNMVAKIRGARGKEIVGYINLWIAAGEVHLHNVAVKETMRRTGIASMLVTEMIRISREEGVAWASLEVRPSNESAIKLYEKFGFTVKGIRPFYYTDPKEDALIMWACLRDI